MRTNFTTYEESMNQEAMKTGKETRTEQPGGEAVASEDFLELSMTKGDTVAFAICCTFDMTKRAGALAALV